MKPSIINGGIDAANVRENTRIHVTYRAIFINRATASVATVVVCCSITEIAADVLVHAHIGCIRTPNQADDAQHGRRPRRLVGDHKFEEKWCN